jgi:hypothetical protein
VVNSPFIAVPTDKTAGDAARGDCHAPIANWRRVSIACPPHFRKDISE